MHLICPVCASAFQKDTTLHWVHCPSCHSLVPTGVDVPAEHTEPLANRRRRCMFGVISFFLGVSSAVSGLLAALSLNEEGNDSEHASTPSICQRLRVFGRHIN